MMSYDDMLDRLQTAVWEIWTNNGRGLDAEGRSETAKTVYDTLANTYTAGMTLVEWQRAALAQLTTWTIETA